MHTRALFLFLAPSLAALAAEAPKISPAINEIEPWQQVGQQPYEMTCVQREEDPRTLLDFEDLAGWTLEQFGGATGELRRSREQQMWGQHVAKVLYRGTGKESRVVARPPKPVPIPGAFDSIDMWGYGNRWGWVTDKTTPAARVSILVIDAKGKEHSIHLTDVNWKTWWLIHRRVPADTLKAIALPAKFSGIEIANAANTAPRHFYFDSLAFYTEELKPLQFRAQPKRNLKPFRGQNVGLNTGEGTLPFPTREETILPSNFEREFQTSVKQTGPNAFELRYEGRDAAIVYEYRPAHGALGEITARAGGASFRPMDGGGLRFSDTPAAGVAQGELVSARVTDDAVAARFRFGSRVANYELRIMQKSLVVDAWCEGGEATELYFGRVSGIAQPKLITVPYLTYGGSSNPRVLLSGGVFTSVWFDWYRTNASQAWTPKQPRTTANSAEINGGMRYFAKTDGRRNNLYERVFVTVTPNYEEALPTIPNPPSLRQQEGKQVVWTVTTPGTFQADHKRSRAIRSYGLDHIMQHSHEVTWRDEGDSYTDKLHAAPQKGGDAMLKWYIAAQNDLGWLQGVYTNYTDFAPVNSNWSPDHVQRSNDGEWRRAWPRTYALKPAKAVEFDEYYAKRIKEKFGVKMSYTDVHSAVAPWDYCDYDARVPGAGTLAATFYSYGQLLLNDQRVYGPTQSEATYQWLYAGLASGHYGWVYTNVNLLAVPPDVSFMLRKLHPLECDYGMGYTPHYLDQLDPKWQESPRKRDYIDLFLATTIAYGNMGWLVNELGEKDPMHVEAMVRSYYMMQQLQQQYAFVEAKRIEYADAAGRFLNPTEAHATGAIAEGRVHVVYENGTEVFVNRNASRTWTVKGVELPVSGWLAFNNAAGFYEISANAGGRRIDYVKAADYEFLDGRGKWTERGNLGATGSVALRHKAAGLELIDAYGNTKIAFASKDAGELTAYDPDGKSLGRVDVTRARDGWYEFKTMPGARSYVFTRSGASA
ncbi:MAG: hypothetical protein ACM336_18155 [Acidobacteriota bacterium]